MLTQHHCFQILGGENECKHQFTVRQEGSNHIKNDVTQQGEVLSFQ